jgi:hypothetical protein
MTSAFSVARAAMRLVAKEFIEGMQGGKLSLGGREPFATDVRCSS